HDEHHDEEEVLMEMFNMSDVDGNQLLDMSELSAFLELLGDGHEEHQEHDGPVGYATIHIEEEGDYGFALPMGVEFFILMGEGGHGDHGDHGDDSAMVCYDISTHTVNSSYQNQADCEGAGLMWVAGNSGPGGQEDHHEGGCHNTTTHQNYESNEADCEAAGHMWTEGHSEQEIVSGEGEEAFDFDPHSWLDPLSYKEQIGIVLDALIVAFPSGEAAFTENAAAFVEQLDSLHSDFDAAFGSTSTCTGTTVAANHNAYAYMAKRYGLEFVTVHGLDPEGEPSAADILEVIEKIEEESITVFFVEEYTSPNAVAAIVEQTSGLEIKTLYTMELPPIDSDDDYLSLMRKNLEGLKTGLGC
ncbi:MAG: metal ABC transporter substrate-binding protein, partial [Candidatus Poseidoniales archaeon]